MSDFEKCKKIAQYHKGFFSYTCGKAKTIRKKFFIGIFMRAPEYRKATSM